MKAFWMLKVIQLYANRLQQALQSGVPLSNLTEMDEISEIARMKEIPHDEAEETLRDLHGRLIDRFEQLEVEHE
jgi:hypothetical protein